MPRGRQRTSSTLQGFLFVVSFELPELTSLPTLSRASLRPPLERLQQALASRQRLRRASAWEMGRWGARDSIAGQAFLEALGYARTAKLRF